MQFKVGLQIHIFFPPLLTYRP